ncbi:MAG: hypothetical protein DSZ26_02540 [Thermovibrio sp.]|nr:MAG: hypothetical protein DSZ26_02540 [Thermovibrio sp.]
MGCCNFGREDEGFPFEKEAEKLIEGINPQWKLNRTFRVRTKKEEIRRKLESVRNALIGFPEEGKISYLISLIERPIPEGSRDNFFFIVNRYLIPFLNRLVFYRVNEPEGAEELKLIIEEIFKEVSTFKKRLREKEIESALDVLIGALYQQLEEGND